MTEWKKTTKGKQIELRKNFGNDLLVIICKNGWMFNNEKPNPKNPWGSSTEGYDIRISMNGPIKLTLKDWIDIEEQIGYAIEEAGFMSCCLPKRNYEPGVWFTHAEDCTYWPGLSEKRTEDENGNLTERLTFYCPYIPQVVTNAVLPIGFKTSIGKVDD